MSERETDDPKGRQPGEYARRNWQDRPDGARQVGETHEVDESG